MKNFLQNLLMVFALCLCGLVAFQWVRETRLRKDVRVLTDTVRNQSEALQSLEARLRGDAAEIQRLDALKNGFAATLKSNRLELLRFRESLTNTAAENARQLKQLDAYKEAVRLANDSIQRQNEDIQRQNGQLQKLAEDRNEAVRKFNQLATNYNALAEKWNQQQASLAKAATNSAAGPKGR